MQKQKFFLCLLFCCSNLLSCKTKEVPPTEQNRTEQTGQNASVNNNAVTLNLEFGTFDEEYLKFTQTLTKYKMSQQYLNPVTDNDRANKSLVDVICLLPKEELLAFMQDKGFTRTAQKIETELPQKLEALNAMAGGDAGLNLAAPATTPNNPTNDQKSTKDSSQKDLYKNIGISMIVFGAISSVAIVKVEGGMRPSLNVISFLPYLVLGSYLIAKNPPNHDTIVASQVFLGFGAAYAGLGALANLFNVEEHGYHYNERTGKITAVEPLVATGNTGISRATKFVLLGGITAGFAIAIKQLNLADTNTPPATAIDEFSFEANRFFNACKHYEEI